MAPLYYLLIDFFGMFSYIVTVMHDYDILITGMAFWWISYIYLPVGQSVSHVAINSYAWRYLTLLNFLLALHALWIISLWPWTLDIIPMAFCYRIICAWILLLASLPIYGSLFYLVPTSIIILFFFLKDRKDGNWDIPRYRDLGSNLDERPKDIPEWPLDCLSYVNLGTSLFTLIEK